MNKKIEKLDKFKIKSRNKEEKNFYMENDIEEMGEDEDENIDNNNEEDPSEIKMSKKQLSKLKLKEELSDMSFGDLIHLKEKVGLKVFQETAFSGEAKKNKNTFPKRLNKNRPSEISSKIKPKKIKESFNKQNHRDPRFEEVSGEFNEGFFRQAYFFIDQIKNLEKEKLLKLSKKEKNEKKKEKIKSLLRRMKQQDESKKWKMKEKEKEKEMKKEEREKIKQGKSPFYLKKSVVKQIMSEEKTKLMGEKINFKKYEEKKEKRKLNKERKRLPFL